MLTQRMQIQALADRLAGLTDTGGAGLRPAQFSEPWLTCWLAIDSAEPHLANHALVQALAAHPERERIVQMILSARPGYLPSYPSLEEFSVDLQPIEWLWPGWIPRGMLTIFGASQGSGKSFVALDLAYRIILALLVSCKRSAFSLRECAVQLLEEKYPIELLSDLKITTEQAGQVRIEGWLYKCSSVAEMCNLGKESARSSGRYVDAVIEPSGNHCKVVEDHSFEEICMFRCPTPTLSP